MLGFILYLLDPMNFHLFAGGGIVLGMIMGISYYFHIRDLQDYGATTMVVALITYCIGPLIILQPPWMVLLIIVTVLILTELKETFSSISGKFDRYEFITLAKFLIIAGIVLPVLPDEPILHGMNLTPYRIWLAVVVISTISYTSYLIKKFLFPQAGVILSGILGGLYSSTATTILLARKSAGDPGNVKQYMAGIIFSIGMMYLRILLLILFFNRTLFASVWYWFIILFLVTMLSGFAILLFRRKATATGEHELPADKNPLEFKMALVFTAMYIALSMITFGVLDRFGVPGLSVLSCIVGLTDIDPFLISLFQGKFGVTADNILMATFQAIVSNNVLKLAYALIFAPKNARIFLVPCFLLIIAITIAVLLIVR
jgi:uncharacterized membrane protein (DUF4010 family)